MATLDHRILLCAVWLAVHSDNQPAKHNILGLPLVAPGALGSDFLIHDLLARTQQKAYLDSCPSKWCHKGQVDEGGKGMGPYRAKSLEQRFWNFNVEGLQHWKLGQDDSEAVKNPFGLCGPFPSTVKSSV